VGQRTTASCCWPPPHRAWRRCCASATPSLTLSARCPVLNRPDPQPFFNTSDTERQALALFDTAKATATAEFELTGFNIGINDGPAAGQPVLHLHNYLILRFRDDQADPRGGVRWVIPEKADYWSGR
jgi:diadenosine tetraphosphate (Ap4A) HIT family hydrolase